MCTSVSHLFLFVIVWGVKATICAVVFGLVCLRFLPKTIGLLVTFLVTEPTLVSGGPGISGLQFVFWWSFLSACFRSAVFYLANNAWESPFTSCCCCCLALCSSMIFTFNDSESGNLSHDSITHRKFSKFPGRLYKSIMVSNSLLISTSMSSSLSTVSTNSSRCSTGSPPKAYRLRPCATV